MSDLIRMQCPDCKTVVRANADVLTKEISCPKCSNNVRFQKIKQPSTSDTAKHKTVTVSNEDKASTEHDKNEEVAWIDEPVKDELSDKNCPFCCSPVTTNAVKCQHCHEFFLKDHKKFAEQIASFEKMSALFWVILGIIQVITIFGIIAGLWNIIHANRLLKLTKDIKNQSSSVPIKYEDNLQGLCAIGLVNLFLGGGIGLIFVGIDFYVRHQILKHSYVFNNG